MNASLRKKFWQRSDTMKAVHLVLVGVALGVAVRWMNASAPPLPVLAITPESAGSTNAPAPLKSEDASPSVRD